MKTTLLTTIFLLLITQLFGQIKIVSVNDFNTDLSGTTVEISGDKNASEIYYDLRVVNEGAPISVKYKRIRLVDSGRTDQICDNSLCYDAADTYDYTSPLLNSIGTGEVATFKPQILPNGSDFCAIHTYYVVSDAGAVYDSITIKFRTTDATCNLSVAEEQSEFVFSIFPNPAKDYITIKGEGLKNGGTVLFLDALGKEVKRSTVKTANSNIIVSDLKRGVYFVNVYGADGAKSNIQRLIIQ